MATNFARTARALDVDRAGPMRLALPIGLLLLMLWGAWFGLGNISLYEVSRQARIEVLTASRQLTIEQGGRLVALQLRAGQVVKAGDVLAELDARPQRLALAAAQARMVGQAARVTALERQLAALVSATQSRNRAAGAATAAATARTQGADVLAGFNRDLAERQRQDSADGGIAQIDAIRAAAAAREAGATRDALSQQQREAAASAGAMAAAGNADVAALQSQLAEARGLLAATALLVRQYRHDLGVRLIRAPVNGVIGAVANLQLGAMLPAGVTLATIVPRDGLHIVARFDPAHGLGRLEPGQTARLRLDGFAWSQYGDVPARVEQVAAEPDAAGLRVELRLKLAPGRAPALRHGMTGTVDVLTEQVSPAILLLRALGQMVA